MDSLPHEIQIQEYIKTIEHLKKQSAHDPIFTAEIIKLEEKLEKLKQQVYEKLTPWERILICRHSSRPHAIDFFNAICEDWFEMSGDRCFGEDHAIVGGLAQIGGTKCVVIGQEKGFDTESRVFRNFGMMNPEGFRKALRLMRLAEKFKLPIVSLLDTPGAQPILEAEERGQGWAIALNLREMARIKTPIIVVIIGEGCSGGALGVGVGDVIGMLQHAYYSVISPEGCASILWKDSSKKMDAASKLKLNSEDLLEMGIIDTIIPEPLGGAHHNPSFVYNGVKKFVMEQFQIFKRVPDALLLEQRYRKFRQIGQFLEE